MECLSTSVTMENHREEKPKENVTFVVMTMNEAIKMFCLHRFYVNKVSNFRC